METLTKRCTDCRRRKPLGEFSRRSSARDGRVSMCKSCISKRYRKTNRANYRKNREKRQDYSRRYRAAHPDYVKRNNARRRARKMGAEGRHTQAEWLALCAKFRNKCLRCGTKSRPLTRDHVVPLSLGGSDAISNIQPLCFNCNGGKRDRVIDYREGKPVVEPPFTSREKPTDPSQAIRVSVEEAARLLGIEKGSVKKRIKRGTLRSERDATGTLYVYVDRSETVRDMSEGQSETCRDELVEELRDRIRSLERRLDEEGEARRRSGAIIMSLSQATSNLTDRLRKLEAPTETPQETPGASETVSEGWGDRGPPKSRRDP